MEKLRSRRGGHRSAITKLIKKTEENLETFRENVKTSEFSSIIDSLVKKQDILITLDDKILEEMDNDSVENEISETDDYNLTLEMTIRRFRNILTSTTMVSSLPVNQPNAMPHTSISVPQNQDINQNTNPTSADPTNQPPADQSYPSYQSYQPYSQHRFHHKLPTLELPIFNGNIMLWQTFWESFESTVHNNPSLTDIQKFTYLKAQLRDSAERCVSGLSLTNTNYEQAIALLGKRFGQQEKIIDAHMQKLVDLPSPTMSLSSLSLFYDKIETSIRGLKSLGQSHETYGALLTPVIFRKLPTQMRTTMTRDRGGRSWNINSLREAIEHEIIAQEAGQLTTADESIATASFIANTRHKSYQHRSTANYQNRRPNTTTYVSKVCVYCDNSHSSLECTSVKDVEARYTIVKRKQLCFNCLGTHKASECNSKYKCRVCDKKHHTSLCSQSKPEYTSTTRYVPAAVNAVNTEKYDEIQPSMSTFYTSSPPVNANKEVLLKTAVASVWNNTQSATANILLDEGSQKSFITEELASQLQIEPNGTTTINLSTFGNDNRNIRHMNNATIDLEMENGNTLSVDVLIAPRIAAPLSNVAHVEATKLPYLRGLKLALPVSADQKFELNLLIGADYYWQIVQDRIIRGEGPTAVKSRLGYLLSGPLMSQISTTASTMMMNILINHKTEEHNLERFWNLESMGVSENEVSTEQINFHEHYEESGIKFNGKENRYCAKLPWKDDCPDLPTNENIVRKRTNSIINRLNQDPKMLEIYGNIIADQEKRGFIERVPEDDETSNLVHYIPHHAVKKDSTTTPIRIVYDCSCRESQHSPSLNDCLMSVTPELNDITGILARFRLHRYATTTDIEKAFLQIELDEGDRDATRFFWLTDTRDANSPLTTYRFKAILFGTTCSPFILSATLLKHLKATPCSTTDILKRNLYVDNMLTSFENQSDLLKFYEESRSILANGGFNLRSWSSNNLTLRKSAENDTCADNDALIKILGLRWKVETDKILFQDNLSEVQESSTKRDILSESSKIFDPLGILSPVTVRAKILMQKIWENKLDWDTCLPADIHKEWNALLMDLKECVKVELPRYYFNDTKNYEGETTLHIFTDSSIRAYGACAYIVRNMSSCLMMAKNRVAPLKSITLPKLELMGAVVGTRLAKHLLDEIGNMKVIFWCDSQIVLNWINTSKPLKTFIANRVKEIKGSVDQQTWRYCPTDTNPADLLTRGITAKNFMKNDLWKHGPKWIINETKWPVWNGNINTTMIELDEQDEDVSGVDTCTMMSVTKGIEEFIDLDRFSSLKRLLRVTAYVLRFITNCRSKQTIRKTDELTVDEINNANMKWISCVQGSEFEDEIRCLEKSTRKSSIIRQLGLYLENNMIRCKGRIYNSTLSETAKHPYLLPTKHRFTTLIVHDAHAHHLHGGVNSTVTHLRQSYWIPRIRQCVRTVIRKCVICRKVTSRAYPKPSQPPLPMDRLQENTPFIVTGVDFAGPLHVRNSDNLKLKAYICLFTCAATRAVHLEVVPNLTEESFILAFRRFVSRRSLPSTMISDNATTYVAASREIMNLSRSVTIHDRLQRLGTTWKFIPKGAPWYGGFWERMVGLTKTCLRKVLGKSLVTMETLETVLTEIEAFLNDRPITYISSDIHDPEPLTPSHLLCGRRITRLPYQIRDSQIVELYHADLNSLAANTRTVIEHFWKRWRSEYLTSLREFHKASGKDEQNIKVGDIVQIENDSPRICWKLGKIEELITGKDGMVRAVKLRTCTGYTNRPISRLYPLEVGSTEQQRTPTHRDAKEKAKQKIREWTT